MLKYIAKRLGFYTRTELMMAVEFGVCLAESARATKKKKYGPVVERLQNIVADEFASRPSDDVSRDMIVLILAAFEPDTQN